MRVAELPSSAAITNGDKDYLGRLPSIGRIEGQHVLVIGYGEDEIDTLIVPHKPAKLTVLTFWDGHPDAKLKKYPVTIGDITKRTPFPDEAFDAIVTLSLLEHVSDLDAALAEMKRVLKPNGLVYSLFGPAWSCAVGHHLYIKADDPQLNFSLWRMPAHLHLLCDEAEISAHYTDAGYAPEIVRRVLGNMFRWDGINRLMYEDYLRAFFRHFRVEWLQEMVSPASTALISQLAAAYPPYRDFTTYGAKIVLRKV